MRKISLENKILIGAISAVAVAVLGCILTLTGLATKNRVNALREDMSGLLVQSENMIETLDELHRVAASDQPHLFALAKERIGSQSLKEGYAKTDLYHTVPVVAAWKSVQKNAEKRGYEFFTPSNLEFVARNAKNDTRNEYTAAFNAFEAGEKQSFFHDKEKGVLVLARPIHYNTSCLAGLGDSSRSLTQKDLDVLGFPKEKSALGDLKGAFLLRAKMTGDPVVKAALTMMAWVSGTIFLAAAILFYVLNDRSVVQPMRRIIRELLNSAQLTAGAANEITGASQCLVEAASEPAASRQETSASLEEIASLTKRNARNAVSSKNLTQQTSRSAAQGIERITEAGRTLILNKSSVGDMESAARELQNLSQEISKQVIIEELDQLVSSSIENSVVPVAEATRSDAPVKPFGKSRVTPAVGNLTANPQINKAIAAHGAWKRRLTEVMQTGQRDTTPQKVERDDECEFGKWIHGMPSAQRDPEHWNQVRTFHAAFHREAANGLRLALAGWGAKAAQQRDFGGNYANISSELTQAKPSWEPHPCGAAKPCLAIAHCADSRNFDIPTPELSREENPTIGFKDF